MSGQDTPKTAEAKVSPLIALVRLLARLSASEHRNREGQSDKVNVSKRKE